VAIKSKCTSHPAIIVDTKAKTPVYAGLLVIINIKKEGKTAIKAPTGSRTIPAPIVVAIPIPPGFPHGRIIICPIRKKIIPIVAIHVGYLKKITGRVIIKPLATSIKKTPIPYMGPTSAYIFEAPGLPVPTERISTFFNFDIRSPTETVPMKYDANAHMADRMMMFKFSMLLLRVLMISVKRYHMIKKTINVHDN
jgi:hypothetical protein